MYLKFFLLSVLVSGYVQAQSFQGKLDLIVSQLYENGNERGDTVSYYFGKEKTALIMHGRGNEPDLRLVFNPADSTITGLFEVNGNKGGYILPMNDKYWPGMEMARREYGTGPKKEFTYTGATMVINGAEAKEVIAESTNYHASIWMGTEIPLNMVSILAYQSVGAGKDASDLEEFDQFGIEGLPFEVHLKSKGNKGVVVLRIKNMSKVFDDQVFSTEGHTLNAVKN